MPQKTLVLLKPDAIEKGLERLITQEVLAQGLRLSGRHELTLTDALVKDHYPHHAGKPYFPRICAYMTRGPCVALVFEGVDAIRKVRELAGATRPDQADPGSIRARFGVITPEGGIENVLHASESDDDATREIHRFFTA